MWIPKINPSVYQVVALFLSFLFLSLDGKVSKVVLLLIILLMDWWDGATARRYGLANEMGYMIDVVVDRLSEMIIFFPVFGGVTATVWFTLALLNILFSFVSYRTGRHVAMPLRFLYLFVLWI